MIISHTQYLTGEQHLFVEKIKIAMKSKTKANHNKPKAIQKLIEYCIKNGIEPEEIVK